MRCRLIDHRQQPHAHRDSTERPRRRCCTLFDAHPLPGGMLRYGIPEYRLPRTALDAEIQVIEQLGGRFEMGVA